MDTLTSDINSECLVTDLVNELSSGLEIPFLLGDDISFVDKQNDTFYDELNKEEKCFNNLHLTHIDDNKCSFDVKSEFDFDLSCCWKTSDVDIHSINQLSINNGRNSGSGSECSSTEIWMVKNELDTPPVTPPDERTSPENTFYLPTDEIKFVPISSEDHLIVDCDSAKFNGSNKIKIQPKPPSTAVDIFDSQESNSSPVVCNVIGDMNSNIINNKLGSNIFLNYGKLGKKSVLSKKDLELQAKRKQERMIRNRESAYLSRKRKKEHVAHLEKQVQELLTENNYLRQENCCLKKRLANYEKLDIPSIKGTKSIFANSPRKATALLALLVTFCLNFGSFSSFLSEVRWSKNEIMRGNMAALYTNEVRHSRSLLWADFESKSLNSTFGNLTKPSCPAFINQSESIRLESELRRWIDGEDDYSTSLNYNISKISQYFYSGDKPKMKNERSKTKIRNMNSNSHKKNSMEMQMYKMRPNLFNFDSFFEAINRRDDTFYLLSFSGDHLLLPALSHNKTSRPKMSLMLPGFLSNVTGITSDQVEMMQIDCEVTNTQVLSVNENNFPTYMRSYSNSSTKVKSSAERFPQKSEKFEDFFSNAKSFAPQKQSEYKPGIELDMNRNPAFSMKRIKRIIKRTSFKIMKYRDPN